MSTLDHIQRVHSLTGWETKTTGEQCEDIFQRTEKLSIEYKIQLKEPNCHPTHAIRKVPLPLRQKLKGGDG